MRTRQEFVAFYLQITFVLTDSLIIYHIRQVMLV